MESSRTSLASRTSSRTHFEVLGLGLEASSPQKLPFSQVLKNCPVLGSRSGQFSRTWGFEAKAKDLRFRSQGLQNMFSRTSSAPRASLRTPPLTGDICPFGLASLTDDSWDWAKQLSKACYWKLFWIELLELSLVMLWSEEESSRTSLATRTFSRTDFEVLGLGLAAVSPRKLPSPWLVDSTIFWTVEILLESARYLAENLRRPFFVVLKWKSPEKILLVNPLWWMGRSLRCQTSGICISPCEEFFGTMKWLLRNFATAWGWLRIE